jgi:hypothetical protein
MVYLKGIIAGILTVAAAATTLYIIGFLVLIIMFRHDGIDLPIVHIHTESVVFWLIVAAVFALGFLWELRRVTQ